MAERSRDGRFTPGQTGGPAVGTLDKSSSNPPLMGAPLAATEPLAPSPRADLTREYVAGGTFTWYGALVRALPPQIDDLTGDFGDDLYDRMLWDPQIAACMMILKAAILEDGLHLNPAVEDADDENYELSKTIFEEAEPMVDDMTDSIEDVLWDMLGCIGRGNRVAEIKWHDADAANGKGSLLNVQTLKVKPRRATAYVVDPYLNTVGLLGRPPGFPSPFLASWLLDPKAPPPNLIPRTRFMVLSYRPTDGDPRGTSLLRSAYEPWWRKRQVYPEMLKYLATFAGPSLWGTVPEKAQAQVPLDADGVPIPGAPLVSPERLLTQALQQIRNGTAGGFPFGTTINAVPVQAARARDPFAAALVIANLEITKCILTQNLATEEGEHQARAAAQVHQDVLDTLVRQGKHMVVRAIRKEVLQQWAIYNWGDRARRLMPKTSLGVTEERDRSGLISAMASLVNAKLSDGSSYVVPSQLQEMDDMLGLPVRNADELPPTPAEMRAEAQAAAEAAQAAAQKLAETQAAAAKATPPPQKADSTDGGQPGKGTPPPSPQASAVPPGRTSSRPGGVGVGRPGNAVPPARSPATRPTSAHMAAGEPEADNSSSDMHVHVTVNVPPAPAAAFTVDRIVAQRDAQGSIVRVREHHIPGQPA